MVPDIESNFYIKQDKFITNVVIKAYNSCHDIIKLIKEYHNQILINNSSGVNYNGIISLVDEEYNSDEIENILISGKKIILFGGLLITKLWADVILKKVAHEMVTLAPLV